MSTSSETADIQVKPRKWTPILLVLSLPAVVFLKMGFFFFVIGMLPTFLAMRIVRERVGHVFSTIAAFNFAGVFPDLLSVTLQQGTPRAVMDKLGDISVWGSMYGAALLGFGIVWLSPSIAMQVLEMVYSGRIRHMEHVQKKMEEEWGPRISGREERRQ